MTTAELRQEIEQKEQELSELKERERMLVELIRSMKSTCELLERVESPHVPLQDRYKDLSQFLKTFLTEQDMTFKTFAQIVGCSDSAVGFWACGKYLPTGRYKTQLYDAVVSLDSSISRKELDELVNRSEPYGDERKAAGGDDTTGNLPF